MLSSSLFTYDFSTLFSTLTHIIIKEKLTIFIKLLMERAHLSSLL